MILSRLTLENFKQFRDPLDLVPPEGAIGVVGSNGSGKTTLFEAILWAFFGTKAGGPRFGNDSIPWSGGSTADRSHVEVTLDVGGASYTVSRSLHRGKATAYIHDEGGTQITSGPTDVTDWVQDKLLEMRRVAFDATFFARQKELAFFSGTTGIDRQREVARILGIDQVEEAQGLLRSDRRVLNAQTKLIEQTLEEVDFDAIEADHTEQKRLHTTLESRVAELTEKLEARTKSLETARAEATRLEKLYREHNSLSSDLKAAVSSRDHSSERIVELETRLRRMDDEERTIRELEPKTEGLPEVTGEIARLEEARHREERLAETKKDLARIRRNIFDTGREALVLVEGLPADGLLSGWSDLLDEDVDELELARAASDLLEDSGEAHDTAVEAHEGLKKVRDLHERLSQNEERLEKAAGAIREKDAEIESLEERMRSLAGDESLPEKIEALRRKQSEVRSESSRLDGTARASEAEAAKMARAWEMIVASDEHAKCPTCQRGYEADEHADVIASIRQRESELSSEAAKTRTKRRELESEAAKLGEEISSLEEARSDLQRLSDKRISVVSTRNNYAEKREEIEDEADELRTELRDSPLPSDADIEASGARVSAWRELRDARPKLLAAISSGDRLHADRIGKETEIERLSGGDPYDGESHTELVARRDEILNLKGNIQTLRNNLADRPDVEEELNARRESKAESVALVSKLESGIKELGFSDEAYETAKLTVAETERLRDEAREEKSVAEKESYDAEGRIASLKKDLDRHEEQRRVADEKSVEAASLNSMDSLFTEFYRELTARVRPKLQREASDMVRTLTDGRYTQMEFDENYGVKLYDGLADAYEISRFSGGESDIASLCARVALSKMISGKGSGTLGFIVLDEVFGALDADRRRNVLVALERLKATFGQIFMISHVADVQESALLDETWFVEEDEDGKSSVRRVRHDLQAAPLEVSANPNPV